MDRPTLIVVADMGHILLRMCHVIGTASDLEISSAQYKAGTDSLHRPDIRALLAECFEHMLTAHSYELSYSQQCRAFFGAAGVLAVVS